jgi:hypothetical protein
MGSHETACARLSLASSLDLRCSRDGRTQILLTAQANVGGGDGAD